MDDFGLRLRLLASAIERFHKGDLPGERELAQSPILTDWTIEPLLVACLEGTVSGHPTLPNGFVRTSQLFVLSSDRRWARTLSRVYRLGAPAGDGPTH